MDEESHFSTVAAILELAEKLSEYWNSKKKMYIRDVPDAGLFIGLIPQIFNLKVVVGKLEFKSDGYDDGFEFTDTEAAIAAFLEWNGTGDPEGWIRHPDTGRRRPNGDLSREFVRK